jgi:hypothetical protein
MIRIFAITHPVTAPVGGIAENGKGHPLRPFAAGSLDLERITCGHPCGLAGPDPEVANAFLTVEIHSDVFFLDPDSPERLRARTLQAIGTRLGDREKERKKDRKNRKSVFHRGAEYSIFYTIKQ